jgi:quercetin dioxygenase-like cupin family protein
VSAFGRLPAYAPVRIWDGVVARVVEGERVSFAVVELEPDSLVPEHSHDNEQVGVLLAGSLAFRIGDETCEVGPGGTWSIPAEVPHQVQAGPDGAVAAEVFAPRRADWETAERLDPCPPRWPA